jgi:nicotinamidase/pyrazinamidase
MKIIFFNVDTQKDFMNKDGKLYIKNAEQIKPNLKFLTEFAKDKSIKVISTGDFHTIKSEELSKSPDFKKTFPEHCIAGSDGAEFIKETDIRDFKDNYVMINHTENNLPIDKIIRARNIVLYKDKFDIFEGNAWTLNVLTLLCPDIVVVYGVATNVCVDFAIKGLLEEDYKVVAVTDAMKELKNYDCESIYKSWKAKGVFLIKTRDIPALNMLVT